jgi:predicted acetyltransferase
MSPGSPLPAGIEVVRATAGQEPVLDNLLELYAHDFSEFIDLQLQPDGRYGNAGISHFWRSDEHLAFLVWVDGRLAGFVMVEKGSRISGDPRVWDVAEFFVVRRWRRRGVGAAVAHEVWRRIPGPWEVRVLEMNRPARAFWKRAVAAFTGSPVEGRMIEQQGKRWEVFSFTAG